MFLEAFLIACVIATQWIAIFLFCRKCTGPAAKTPVAAVDLTVAPDSKPAPVVVPAATVARVTATGLKTTMDDLDRWDFTAAHAGPGLTQLPVGSLTMLLHDARVAHRLSSGLKQLKVRVGAEEVAHAVA